MEVEAWIAGEPTEKYLYKTHIVTLEPTEQFPTPKLMVSIAVFDKAENRKIEELTTHVKISNMKDADEFIRQAVKAYKWLLNKSMQGKEHARKFTIEQAKQMLLQELGD